MLADTDVNKIVALLLWMSQDFAVDANMSVDEIEEAANAAILVYCKTLTRASSAKLFNLIDIMMKHKDGSA